ncbi:MAG: hypothetical protein C0456_05205 [Hyphomonas sp.]|uniref:RcnB family protein n=1 Tax=Hyphomonas sp. TaxID=87 RepID=UPI001D524464|nr:RcnB family protein [Hyphomonas sp.]MBA4226012.1 hypothetical protein [Hyphomonas sp.]
MFVRPMIILLAGAVGGTPAMMAEPPAAGDAGAPEELASALPGGDDFDQGDPPLISRDRSLMWGKGQRLPPQFRQAEFRDWKSYHLTPPPEGYRWVRVDRGAYRVDMRDGYIAEAVFGLPGG